MHNREIDREIHDAADAASEQVRQYANGASKGAQNLLDRGRRLRERFGKRANPVSQRLTNAAEDLADEANYQYRRLRRQVNRHPAATVAVVAGTVGAFLLLRLAFRGRHED